MYIPMSKTVFQDSLSRDISILLFKKIVLKGTPKWRECTFSNEKPKSFQGPKVGSGPRPIRAHFVHMTLLHGVGKNWPKKFGVPLTKSWICPCRGCNLYFNCIRKGDRG